MFSLKVREETSVNIKIGRASRQGNVKSEPCAEQNHETRSVCVCVCVTRPDVQKRSPEEIKTKTGFVPKISCK